MSKAAEKTVIQNLAVNHYLYHVNERKFHQVEGEFIIGRQTGNLILTGDPKISRQHCRFKAQGIGLFVSDLGSTNKTYLNGIEVGVDDVYLKVNDKIQMGENTFFYTDTKDPTPFIREGRLTNTPFLWKNVFNFRNYTRLQLKELLSSLMLFTFIDALFIFGFDTFPDLEMFGHFETSLWPWVVFLSHFAFNLVVLAAFLTLLSCKPKASFFLKSILVLMLAGFMLFSCFVNILGGIYWGQEYIYRDTFYVLLEKNIQDKNFPMVRNLYWNCHAFVPECHQGKNPKPKKIQERITSYRENEWKTLLKDRKKWEKMVEEEKKMYVHYNKKIEGMKNAHLGLKASKNHLNDNFFNDIFILYPGISLEYFLEQKKKNPDGMKATP